jgi:molybdopterin-guanine dinucleotide biosynthesis protein MobB
MSRIFAFVGTSGSGKTRVVTELVRRFVAKGYGVIAAKHCRGGFELDREGKDSFKLREAGAKTVILSSPEASNVLMDRPFHEGELLNAIKGMQGLNDVALLEGFRHVKGIPKIEVLRQGVHEEIQTDRSELLAVVSDFEEVFGVPRFAFEDIENLMTFLEKEFDTMTDDDIQLEVDGTPVPANPFVRRVLRTMILSFVRELKGIPDDARDVTVRIKGPLNLER